MRKLSPVAVAAASLVIVESTAAEREVAMRIPIKEGMRELGKKMAQDLDDALHLAAERHLGAPLTDPEILRGRLTVHPDLQPEGSTQPQGVTYAFDGVGILWAGPVAIGRFEDELRASRPLRHLLAELGP